MSARLADLPARIASKIAIDETSGCWLWQAYVGADGYGVVSVKVGSKHRMRRAHLVIYELIVGPIPHGLEVDHTCHNPDLACPGGSDCLHRRCVNPAHLEAVPPQVNSRRKADRVTRCPQGHAYDEANTYLSKQGKRQCRICRRDIERLRRERKGDIIRARERAHYRANREAILAEMRERYAAKKRAA